jgi:hypothetical protein
MPHAISIDAEAISAIRENTATMQQLRRALLADQQQTYSAEQLEARYAPMTWQQIHALAADAGYHGKRDRRTAAVHRRYVEMIDARLDTLA